MSQSVYLRYQPHGRRFRVAESAVSGRISSRISSQRQQQQRRRRRRRRQDLIRRLRHPLCPAISITLRSKRCRLGISHLRPDDCPEFLRSRSGVSVPTRCTVRYLALHDRCCHGPTSSPGCRFGQLVPFAAVGVGCGADSRLPQPRLRWGRPDAAAPVGQTRLVGSCHCVYWLDPIRPGWLMLAEISDVHTPQLLCYD